jgi:hypothetical protein
MVGSLSMAIALTKLWIYSCVCYKFMLAASIGPKTILRFVAGSASDFHSVVAGT